ncbi:MAG: 2-hydroxyacid dehydrogenase [Pseudomonadota bacterium]
MKPKIFIACETFPEVIAYLAPHCDIDEHRGEEGLQGAALAARLADKDAAMLTTVERVDAGLLAACPRLKAVCNIAVGYNNIDVAACTAAGVMVTNTPGVLDDTTADLAWALILASARHVVAADKWLRAGKWPGLRFKQWLGSDVHHATLGIFGMGRIGQAVARRAQGFAMRVLYHNRRRLAVETEQAVHAEYVTKEALLRESDFVVLMLPYAPENHHYIGAAELALMKPTAHLINVARGGIVDDAALVAALQEGRIGGAGLDVYENEPALHPGFLELSNAVLTPHIGSASHATRLKMAMRAAENLVAALATGSPPNLVNPEVRRGY